MASDCVINGMAGNKRSRHLEVVVVDGGDGGHLALRVQDAHVRQVHRVQWYLHPQQLPSPSGAVSFHIPQLTRSASPPPCPSACPHHLQAVLCLSLLHNSAWILREKRMCSRLAAGMLMHQCLIKRACPPATIRQVPSHQARVPSGKSTPAQLSSWEGGRCMSYLYTSGL